VTCVLDGGASGTASVPSGASTGTHEALELRDKDPKRFNGLGVLTAVKNVNGEIAAYVKGKDLDQAALDRGLIALDGTENKSRLGANAILGVSLAFARASALAQGIELYEYLGRLAGTKKFALPQPMLNVINGGKHADSGLDMQEFMLGPTGFDTFARKMQAGAEVVMALKKLLQSKGYSTSIGDEGGFAPKLSSNEEALALIEEAVKKAGYTLDQVRIGLDVAASEFYKDGVYSLSVGGTKKDMSSADMIAWYEKLASEHSIVSIEDGLSEDDWDGFTALTAKIGGTVRIVGDDLTVTNVKRVKSAIEKKAINSVLIKLNQIGSLTETIETIQLTRSQGWVPFISHRSGETSDTFIADLAVGLACEFIKAGSTARGERVAKYNRLMEIESRLGRA
jgi:enolase